MSLKRHCREWEFSLRCTPRSPSHFPFQSRTTRLLESLWCLRDIPAAPCVEKYLVPGNVGLTSALQTSIRCDSKASTISILKGHALVRALVDPMSCMGRIACTSVVIRVHGRLDGRCIFMDLMKPICGCRDTALHCKHYSKEDLPHRKRGIGPMCASGAMESEGLEPLQGFLQQAPAMPIIGLRSLHLMRLCEQMRLAIQERR